MKVIEKPNGQIFEIYNKKEFGELVRDLWADNGDIWQDEDSTLYLQYSDGTEIIYMTGDKKQPLKLHKLVKGINSNSATIAIYKAEIIYNEHYEDYEVI